MTKSAIPANGGAMPASPLNLSFVTAKAPRGNGLDYWSVEPTGSYTADCDKGRVLGEEFAAFIGRHPTNGSATLLGCIVLDMIQKQTPNGLVVGFMGVVNRHAMTAAALIPCLANAA